MQGRLESQLLGSAHKFSAISCRQAAKKKDKASEAEPDSKPKPVAFGCEAIGSGSCGALFLPSGVVFFFLFFLCIKNTRQCLCVLQFNL